MALRPFLALAALVAGIVAFTFASAQEGGAPRRVYLAEITGIIGPASAHFTEQAIEKAEEGEAEALILQMNTPGGLATSMREMIQTILAARVPVIGYVAPSGGHAASAGTFILYATHVAAMAPGTNVGAASPVQIGGGETAPDPFGEKGKEKEKEEEKEKAGSALDAKATNDAVALIRGLATMRGRNADWAESAVREAAALSAQDALEANVIEINARDVDDLLAQLDGRSVEIGGETRTLRTRGATIERVEPSVITKVLGVLANPNVALLLMMLGVYGVIYEFLTPGTIGPGVVGVILLILGLYALNQLPLNYAGLMLIGLGVALMAGEAVSPSFGLLGVAGVVAFIIGAFMLIDTDIPAFQLSPTLIFGTAGVLAVALIFVLGYAVRAQTRRKASALDRLTEERAQVLDWQDGQGHVWAQGERWSAEGDSNLSPGETVRITGRTSLRLRVAAGAPRTGANS